jgi:hypothetical protein
MKPVLFRYSVQHKDVFQNSNEGQDRKEKIVIVFFSRIAEMVIFLFFNSLSAEERKKIFSFQIHSFFFLLQKVHY